MGPRRVVSGAFPQVRALLSRHVLVVVRTADRSQMSHPRGPHRLVQVTGNCAGVADDQPGEQPAGIGRQPGHAVPQRRSQHLRAARDEIGFGDQHRRTGRPQVGNLRTRLRRQAESPGHLDGRPPAQFEQFGSAAHSHRGVCRVVPGAPRDLAHVESEDDRLGTEPGRGRPRFTAHLPDDGGRRPLGGKVGQRPDPMDEVVAPGPHLEQGHGAHGEQRECGQPGASGVAPGMPCAPSPSPQSPQHPPGKGEYGQGRQPPAAGAERPGDRGGKHGPREHGHGQQPQVGNWRGRIGRVSSQRMPVRRGCRAGRLGVPCATAGARRRPGTLRQPGRGEAGSSGAHSVTKGLSWLSSLAPMPVTSPSSSTEVNRPWAARQSRMR